jgi:hypothetical protein
MTVRLIISALLLSYSGRSIAQQSKGFQYIHQHITYLSSDSLEGRLVGSKGETLAADYLKEQLSAIGLKPYKNSYTHPFSYIHRSNPHDSISDPGNVIEGKNVIGFLDNQSNRTTVIGAHYDHLGRNEHLQSTAVDSYGEIHNGADDNASGVAAVLEIARSLLEDSIVENSNFIFAFFSGEEDGLIGSKLMVEALITDSVNITCMINLDMIGRMDTLRTINIGGFSTSPEFGPILERNNHFKFNIKIDSSGIGPSDHTSFYLKNIPVLFFNTGTHQDYHKPSDDHEKINYQALLEITEYVNLISVDLSSIEKLNFTPTRSISRSKPQYKVKLGIMPNYSFAGKGVLIDGVSAGKPAEIGGLQNGDIILEINEMEILDIYSYMNSLSLLQMDKDITVKINRNGIILIKQLKLQ